MVGLTASAMPLPARPPATAPTAAPTTPPTGPATTPPTAAPAAPPVAAPLETPPGRGRGPRERRGLWPGAPSARAAPRRGAAALDHGARRLLLSRPATGAGPPDGRGPRGTRPGHGGRGRPRRRPPWAGRDRGGLRP